MKLLFILSLITLLTSCGKIVDKSIGAIVDQADSFLSGSSNVTTENLEGVWESQRIQQFANIDYVFEDSLYSPISEYQKVTPESFETIISQNNSCDYEGIEREGIDIIDSRLYFQFSNDSYKMFSVSRVTLLSGESMVCNMKVGDGKFSIIGSYLVLKDHNKSVYVEFLSYEETLIGFTE